MQTSREEIALTTVFKSSLCITKKHHKKLKSSQHLECHDFYITQRTGESLITVLKVLVVLKIQQNVLREATLSAQAQWLHLQEASKSL